MPSNRAQRAARQAALLTAIDAGVVTLRELMTAARIPSTSVARYELEALADQGKIVLEQTTAGVRVYTGVDYARGWDAAAKLQGNPDA